MVRLVQHQQDSLWSRVLVSILPPLWCDVSGDPGHVSREMVDSLGLVGGLVVAVGVEGEFADELAGLLVDDADVSVGDEELDGAVLVGSLPMPMWWSRPR
jgi:hypothetical protein